VAFFAVYVVSINDMLDLHERYNAYITTSLPLYDIMESRSRK